MALHLFLTCAMRKDTRQLENDMRNISYSGGQPVKWVMKYILQQEYNRTKQIIFPSGVDIVWRKKKEKNTYKAFTLCTMSSLGYH